MADKKTIGTTDAGGTTLDAMQRDGHFKFDIVAAQFAIGLAIARGLQPSELTDAGTKWSTSSFERIRDALPALGYDTAEPYRAVESLLDQGLRLVQADIDKIGHFRFARFITADPK